MSNAAAAVAIAILASVLACTSPACAQETPPEERAALLAERDAINAETRGSVFPGPRDGETRTIWVWRPPGVPATGPIPTLYMFDGMNGVYVGALRLRPAIVAGRLAPIQIVAIDASADRDTRGREYVYDWPGGRADFVRHEDWFFDQVLPWSERTQRAARDPAHRFIGGFSNGANMAFVLALERPDLFGGGLLHSPVSGDPDWLGNRGGSQRWVVTFGTQERLGSIRRRAGDGRDFAQTLTRRGAAVRSCFGPWRHDGRAWREVSPGSIAWLMGLGEWRAVETERERESCETPT